MIVEPGDKLLVILEEKMIPLIPGDIVDVEAVVGLSVVGNKDVSQFKTTWKGQKKVWFALDVYFKRIPRVDTFTDEELKNAQEYKKPEDLEGFMFGR